MNELMDKRLTSDIFRTRLADLQARSGLRQSAFAKQLGIDRSALSQLLHGAGARLPRADTLVTLAETHQVSVDWLLGLSEDQSVMSETRDMLEIAGGADTIDQSPLAQLHEDARGAKIRYVPSGLPDILRVDLEQAQDPGQFRRVYLKRPETDMEVAMPLQRLQELALAEGIWSGVPSAKRKSHLHVMAQMIEEFYPRLRVYLYDGRERFSMPYTVFGHQRVAVYAGEIYLLLNGRQTIQTMADHFDNLVKSASVHAHEAADYVAKLSNDIR